MSILNDPNCGWINSLPKRIIKKLNNNLTCDYLIKLEQDTQGYQPQDNWQII